MPPARKKRLQFDFIPSDVSLLDTLVEMTGHRSRADVVRRALGLYHTVVQSVQSGHSILIQKSDGTSERLNFMP